MMRTGDGPGDGRMMSRVMGRMMGRVIRRVMGRMMGRVMTQKRRSCRDYGITHPLSRQPSLIVISCPSAESVSSAYPSLSAHPAASAHPALSTQSASSAEGIHNLPHLRPLLLHVLHQAELGAAAVQVVLFPGNLKVGVALKVIRQETHPAFQGHKPRALGKHPDLLLSQASRASFKESLCIYLKQWQGQGYLA